LSPDQECRERRWRWNGNKRNDRGRKTTP
jgi:hypothetical protein